MDTYSACGISLTQDLRNYAESPTHKPTKLVTKALRCPFMKPKNQTFPGGPCSLPSLHTWLYKASSYLLPSPPLVQYILCICTPLRNFLNETLCYQTFARQEKLEMYCMQITPQVERKKKNNESNDGNVEKSHKSACVSLML